MFPVDHFRVHCVGCTGNHIEGPVVFNGNKTYLAGCIATNVFAPGNFTYEIFRELNI